VAGFDLSEILVGQLGHQGNASLRVIA